MRKKEALLKESAKIFQRPTVAKWYKEYLEGRPQYETVNSLERAVEKRELTNREALSIALIVGFQWREKFEGIE